MEVIDIGLDNLEPVSFNLQENEPSTSTNEPSSVNFGPGVELLMNDKKISSTSSTKVDIEDLNDLENELNTLTQNIDDSGVTPEANQSSSTFGGLGNMFGMSGNDKKDEVKIDIGNVEEIKPASNIGAATLESVGTTKTWDGFSKTNEVPINASTGSKLSDREKRRKKRAMIKKLEEWYEKGLIKHTSNFNMDSDFDEVEDEYETAMEDKRKKDSVKLQGWWFTTLVNSLEYANAVFDPFGLNLDGWGEQINEDIDSYEEIFAELHEKYKGGKMSPEISLLLRLGFSGAVLNITNKALSTATPGFNDVIKQSPELMKMFSAATAQTMNNQNPGFEFVNSVLHPEEQVNTSFGVPPPPVETKGQPAPQRPTMQYTNAPNRPDIAMGRGAMFREEGVDVNNQFGDIHAQQPQPRSKAPERAEMRGPQNVDLDNLLSGLKTRDVEPKRNDENESMISASSIQENQNTVLPKKTRRKQRSDKNVVAIDI
jgi:hypothetical protein